MIPEPSKAVDSTDLTTMPVSDLFVFYRGILRELRARGVVRTENAPAGDYAEFLVAAGLGGTLAPNSEKSWDVRLPDGTRLQVKSRVVSDPPKSGQLQLSPFRSFDFDEAVLLLLADSDYTVDKAVRVPREVIEAAAVYSSHVNGHIAHARSDLIDGPLAVDVTSLLRAAAGPQPSVAP